MRYDRIIVIQFVLLAFGLVCVAMNGPIVLIGSAVCFFSAGIGTANLLRWEGKK